MLAVFLLFGLAFLHTIAGNWVGAVELNQKHHAGVQVDSLIAADRRCVEAVSRRVLPRGNTTTST